MKSTLRIVRVAGVLLSLIALPGLCFSNKTAAHFRYNLADLSWLSGHWQTTGPNNFHIEEHWTDPVGALMVGVGRTSNGTKTEEFEFLRIEQRADEIFYVASPNGQCPATDFKLIQLDSKEAVFANPEHDFPKRIIYRKTGVDRLTASIDGGTGTKSIVFNYTRQ